MGNYKKTVDNMRLKCQFESCCNGRCCGRIWWRLAFWHNFQWILSTTTGSDSGDPNSTGPKDSCKKFWPIKRQLETVSTNHRTVAVPLWMHLCKMSLLLNLVGANKRVMRSTRMVGGGLWYENKKKHQKPWFVPEQFNFRISFVQIEKYLSEQNRATQFEGRAWAEANF